MTRTLGLLILLLLSFAPLRADDAGTSATTPAPAALPEGHFYLEVDGGIDLPMSGWQSAYSLGPGFEVKGGYTLDPNWAIQLDLETFFFSGTNAAGNVSDEEVLALPTVRYQFGGTVLKPYLLAGLGVEFESLSNAPFTTPVTDFDGAVGAGCETGLTDRLSLFVEGKYNFIFSSKVTAQDLPLVAGLHLDID